MGRQYSSNKRSSRQRGGAPQQFLIIIVTFMLGYLTASVFNVEKLSHWVSTQVLEHSQEKKQPIKAETQQAQVPPKPKPKFEFYTLLANEKAAGSTTQPSVNTTANRSANRPTPPTSATHAASAAAVVAATARPAPKSTVVNPKAATEVRVPTTRPVQATRGNFMVQVAAFKARQDAEHMKGMLILKGFNVNVVPITHQTRGVWYRVVVGPYANRALAQRAQETLARNERLRGMVTAG
ncbi:SPOR domain-containing protein [Legionella fallonii]|uniref:SPOR domain-containing protein n=1 Tax=Legionella fallonii LLAP-10 TaxID=1212491 RepID=A0A098G7W1_9GAMM|nr:SPOR domain-containing protein [Legionella fallonii]CEG57610.1 conserved protein of unknown function [Legionella fallonii LLAP-10]